MDTKIASILLGKARRSSSLCWSSLFEKFGSSIGILNAPRKELEKIVGAKAASSIEELQKHWKWAEEEWERASQLGVEILDLGDSRYPLRLKEIDYPPVVLYAQGDLSVLQIPLWLAVVGSRRSSLYGVSQTKRFALSLAELGVVIVSGLAIGIDRQAHLSALSCCGKTVAVLGSGLERIYPKQNKNLAKRIRLEGGLLLSEFPLQTPPCGYHFPWRNRVISGLSKGVLVVEAGVRSGSLLTAQWALEQGREIFGVPGPVDSPLSYGVNELLKRGATLVQHPWEVLEEMLAISQQKGEEIELGELEHRILRVIHKGKKHLEQILAELNRPLQEVLPAMLRLELACKVRKWPGDIYELLSPEKIPNQEE
ncbi:MAG: DNA-protecting protein DprA [Planctomycetota bacterium]|nr:MAG: DNA-protecting protein DprA [Planctomycetota bacterium]